MSPSTRTPIEQLTEHAEATDASVLFAAPRAVAFWTSIALPLAYAPLLWNGLHASEAMLLTGLLVANIVAFVLGHGHLSDVEARTERSTTHRP